MRRPGFFLIAFSLVFTTGVSANPVGEQVIAGQANFTRAGAQLNINQLSDRVIINWQDFSIANGELTKFIQPNSTSAALNRVVTGNLSSLFGDLQANGQVYLINPNGVVIGADANINTQSFIASTLNVDNAEFMNGGDLNFVGDSEQSIEHLGTIDAEGGDVFLIARHVDNSGTIKADNHTGLAGGTDVLLKANGDDRLAVRVTDKDGRVDQTGLIEAAKIELRTAGNNPYALAINHEGISRATSAVNQNGRIILFAEGGTTIADGTLDASAPISGNGGFIETSGTHVKIADTVNIDTSSANGETGEWLIDPNDFTIASSGGDITGTTLATQLDSNNVTIETATQGTPGNGDIFVNESVTSTSSNSLTLNAERDVRVNQSINIGGDINLNAGNSADGADGNDATITPTVLAATSGTNGISGGNVHISAALTSTSGNINLNAGDGGDGGDGGNGSNAGIGSINPGNNAGDGGVGGSVFVDAAVSAGGAINIIAGDGGRGGIGGRGESNLAPGSPGGNAGEGGDGGNGGDVIINSQITAGTNIFLLAGAADSGGRGGDTQSTTSLTLGFTGNGGNGGNGGNVVINTPTLDASTGHFQAGNSGVAANAGSGIGVANFGGGSGGNGGAAGTVALFQPLQFNGTGDFTLVTAGGRDGGMGSPGGGTGSAGSNGISGGNGDINLNQTITTTGNVIINSGGDISGGALISANDIDLIVNNVNAAIGTIVQGVFTNASGIVTATASNGNGGIFLSKQGDFDISNLVLNSGTGNAQLTALDGNLISGATAFNFIGAGLILVNTEQTFDSSAGNRNIHLGSGGINAAGTNITLISADDVIVDGAINAASVTATAGEGKNGSDTFIEPGSLNRGQTGRSGERGGTITINQSITSTVGDINLNAARGGFGFSGGNGSTTGFDDNNPGGIGGNSGGTGGAGGTGGSITVNAALDAQQNINLTAGIGSVGGRGGDGSGNGGAGALAGGNSGGTGGAAGAGGSINIAATLTAQQDITLTAGIGLDGGQGGAGTGTGGTGETGGNSGGSGGAGSAGGNITIDAVLSAQQNINLVAGAGGSGNIGGDGEDGGTGTITGGTGTGTGGVAGTGGTITVNAALDAQQNINLVAGDSGTGGTGGSFGDTGGNGTIIGGNAGGTGGAGSTGGSITVNAILDAQQSTILTAGAGGTGGRGGGGNFGGSGATNGNSGGTGGTGGTGGSITINTALSTQQDIVLTAGSGGTGGDAGNGPFTGGNSGDGGDGGSLNLNNSLLSHNGNISLDAGMAGIAGVGFAVVIPGSPGNAGQIQGSDIDVTATTGSVSVNGEINAGTDDVVLSAGDQLTISDLITANNISLTAAGLNAAIGASGSAIQINASGIITANASIGNGGIFLKSPGDLNISSLNLNAGTGNAALTAEQGSLNIGAVNVTAANNVTLTTTERENEFLLHSTGVLIPVSNQAITDIADITIGSGGIQAVNSNLVIDSADNVSVAGDINVTSATITAGDGVNGAFGVLISSGANVRVGTDGTDGEQGGSVSIDGAVNASGAILITAGSGGDGGRGKSTSLCGVPVASCAVSAGDAGLAGDAGNLLINGDLTSSAGSITLASGDAGNGELGGNGFGTVQVPDGSASNAAAAGNLVLNGSVMAAADIAVNGGDGGDSPIMGTDAGQITQNAVMSSSGGNVTVNLGSAGLLDGVAGHYEDGVLNGSQIDITASTGSVAINGEVDAGSNDVNLNGNTGITVTELITANNINLTAAGTNAAIGSSGSAINTNASGVITASANNGNGGIFLSKQGDFDISNLALDSGTGDAELTAVNGNLTSGTTAFSFVGANLNLVTIEDASNDTASDRNIQIGSGGISAASTNITITAADDVLIGGDVSAASLTLSAGDGVDDQLVGERGGDITIDGSITTLVGAVSLTAGNGGIGESASVAYDGGRGGAIHVNSEITGKTGVTLVAGAGAHGGESTASGGFAGHGGSGGDVIVHGALTADSGSIDITAGDGGAGGGLWLLGSGGVHGSESQPGNGGSGGKFNVNSPLSASAGDIRIRTGHGGSPSQLADRDYQMPFAGAGGDLTIDAPVAAAGMVDILTGSGGPGGILTASPFAVGGEGEAAGAVTVNAPVTAGSVLIVAGTSGIFMPGVDVTINQPITAVSGNIELRAGSGGLQSISGFSAYESVDGRFGTSSSMAFPGGNGGQVTVNAVLHASQDVLLYAGDGGDGNGGFSSGPWWPDAKRGDGGDIVVSSDITAGRDLMLHAPSGANGNFVSSPAGDIWAPGSDGGTVVLNAVLVADRELTIHAGTGGSSQSTPGTSGIITGAKIDARGASITVSGPIEPDAGSSVSLLAGTASGQLLTLNTLQDLSLTGTGSLSLQGFGFNSANNYSTVDGDININSGDGDLDLNGMVTATNGDVTLTSGGNLTASQIITGNNIGLIASGLNSAIGSTGAGAIQTNASGIITANASNGTGGIFISKQGDFNLQGSTFNSGTGDAELTAVNGNLTTGASTFNFNGANLTLTTTEDASNNTAGDRNIQIGSGGINAANTNITFTSADDVIVDGAINAESVTATTGDGKGGTGTGAAGERGGDITVNQTITSSLGNIQLTTGNGGHGAADALGNPGGTGGAGGSITINTALNAGQDILLTAGNGGQGASGFIASTGGVGGIGGNVTINAALNTAQDILLTAGRGGSGGSGGDAASSGPSVFTSAGGGGGEGGVGGSLTVNASLDAGQDIQLTTGKGGDGGRGGEGGRTSGSTLYVSAGGIGGSGGSGGSVTVNSLLNTGQNLQLTAGLGGAAGFGGEGEFGFASNGFAGEGASIFINAILNAGQNIQLTVGAGDSDGEIKGNQIDATANNGSITINGLINPNAGGSVSLLAGTAAGQTLTFTSPQDFNLTASGSLSLRGFGFSSANNYSTVDGDININSGDGDLTLNTGFTATSTGSGNIILAGNNFHNDTGTNNPLAVNTGRFVVYSTRPDNNRNDIGTDINAIAHDFVEYGTIFDPNNLIPASLPAGNGFVYSIQPILTGVTVTVNNQTIDYGQTINTTDFSLVGGAPGSYEVGGSGINAAEFELTTPGSITAGDITLVLDSSVGLSTAGFAEARSYTSGIEAVFASGNSTGLSLNGVGDLTVNVVDLNVTLAADNKVYDATTGAVLSIASDDRVTGDILSVDPGTSAFADKNVGIAKTVTVAGTTLTGDDAANYNLVISNVGSLTADISAADLIINGAAAQAKTYDGTSAATVTGSVTALLSDVVNLNLDSATFADKNVGVGKAVTASHSISGTDAGNYNLIQATGLTADITARTLTASLTANDKVYDALTTTTGILADDRVAGDVLTVNNIGINFADKNAGVGKTVTAAGLSLSGTDAGNYVLASTTANDTADITVRTLNAVLAADDKIYDATTTAIGLLNDDRIAGDVLTVDNSGFNFADKNAGVGKTVTAGGLSLSGTDAGNYVLAATSVNDTADITAADLIINSAVAQDKVYDGNTDATVTGASVTALLSDVVNLNLDSADFADKNVGTGKVVTTSHSISGADAGNYNLIQATGLIADITTRALNASLTANDKVYDALTTATGVFGDDRIAGDVLTVNNGGINFDNKNVGVGKTVTASGLSISGTDAGNYILASTTANDTADITVRTITASLVADDKIYDALTTATGVLNDDRVAGDVLTISNTGINFSDKNAGVAKTVTASGLSLSGTDAGNYVLSATNANGTADITAADLIINGAVAQDKVYDGTTAATVTGANVAALLTDTVNLNLDDADFADKNVGNGKAITTSYSISGVDAGNYNLIQPTGLIADITARTLNASLTAHDKVYDATSTATGVFGDDRVAGDTLTINSSTLDFSDANAGVGKTVTAIGLSLSGSDAGNYVLASNTADDTADITQAALSVTANDFTRNYNTAAFSGGNGVSFSGFVGGETQVDLSGALTFAGSSQGATDVGSYIITPGGLSSSNYAISFVDGELAINSVPLSVTANDFNKVFDGDAFNGGNGVMFDGFVGSDDESDLLGSLDFDGSSQGAVNPGEFAITPLGLTSNNYDIAFVDGTLTIDPLTSAGSGTGSGSGSGGNNGNGGGDIVNEFENFQAQNNANTGNNNGSPGNSGNNGNNGNNNNFFFGGSNQTASFGSSSSLPLRVDLGDGGLPPSLSSASSYDDEEEE